jgi:hypothetical protein
MRIREKKRWEEKKFDLNVEKRRVEGLVQRSWNRRAGGAKIWISRYEV